MKCGECPNQAFLPVEDQVILDHLQGRHVIGVYPLLTDQTCWFLAADFDKTSWTDDVAAFVETCRANGLPAAVERSRSGNGAHVWFFFSAPVAAGTARKMGCYLFRRDRATRDCRDRQSISDINRHSRSVPPLPRCLGGARQGLVSFPGARDHAERHQRDAEMGAGGFGIAFERLEPRFAELLRLGEPAAADQDVDQIALERRHLRDAGADGAREPLRFAGPRLSGL